MTLTVTQLRVEHRTDSLGIGVTTPRLSWIVESDDTTFGQQSYEVIADDPDDPDAQQRSTVQSKDSVLVPWPFDPLPSRSRRRISVRVAGPDGQFSASSDAARRRGRAPRSNGLDGAADHRRLPGIGRRTSDQVPQAVHHPARRDPGAAVRLGTRRLHRRLQRSPRSATRSSPPAGPRTAIDSGTPPSTSRMRSATATT